MCIFLNFWETFGIWKSPTDPIYLFIIMALTDALKVLRRNVFFQMNFDYIC